jgi:hypothetical protein
VLINACRRADFSGWRCVHQIEFFAGIDITRGISMLETRSWNIVPKLQFYQNQFSQTHPLPSSHQTGRIDIIVIRSGVLRAIGQRQNRVVIHGKRSVRERPERRS